MQRADKLIKGLQHFYQLLSFFFPRIGLSPAPLSGNSRCLKSKHPFVPRTGHTQLTVAIIDKTLIAFITCVVTQVCLL